MDPSEQMKIFVRIVELRQIAFGKHLNYRFCFLLPQKPYLSKARTQGFGMMRNYRLAHFKCRRTAPHPKIQGSLPGIPQSV